MREMYVCTDNEESTHGEEHTCVGVVEKFGMSLVQFVISLCVNLTAVETAVFTFWDFN